MESFLYKFYNFPHFLILSADKILYKKIICFENSKAYFFVHILEHAVDMIVRSCLNIKGCRSEDEKWRPEGGRLDALMKHILRNSNSL